MEIVVDTADVGAVSSAIRSIPNIASVTPVFIQDPTTRQPTGELKVVDGKALLHAILDVPADSTEAKS